MLKDTSDLNPLRRKLLELEDKLNEMTKGEFYGEFASRGLETYKVREMKRLLLKYPQIREVLRTCIIAHIEFYEKLLGSPLTDEKWKRDSTVQNLLSLQRHFGIQFSLADYIKRQKR